MGKELIWAYFLQLSNHYGADEGSPSGNWYDPPPYQAENRIDLDVWDEMVRFVAERKYNMVLIDVGDGMKYDTHPEISAPDAWSKDFLKKKLDELRALGLEPIPKLNFSACHHAWLKEYRRMLGTPTYYKVVEDLIGEVCEVFGHPRLFHLGMDEESANMQELREMIVVRNENLLWHDLYFYFDVCEKNGARPWVWSDYYWSHPDIFVKRMPKSVLQSNWFYREFRNYKENSPDYRFYHYLSSYAALDELGYDQLPTCSTWAYNRNPRQTLCYGRQNLNPEHLLGYLTAPWAGVARSEIYTLKNDADRLYVGRKEVYPETL